VKNKKQEKNLIVIPQEIIEQKIFLIRGKKVMLDRDLAELYGVETRTLNQAVMRNKDRFPADFMFQLNKEESDALRYQFGTLDNDRSRSQFVILNKSLRSQIVTSKRGQNIKYLPYVFTEQGVAMLSSVLNSKIAIQVNIQIIRTFTRIRELIISNKELRIKLEELEKKTDKRFEAVFKVITKLIADPETKNKKKIGFRVK
jgi:hypothetical protein